MKPWYLLLPVAALSILSYFGCSRDGLPDPTEQLVGHWEWLESSTPEDQTKLTPAVTGHTSAIEFDNRGRACFFQDGHMTGAATFTVRRTQRPQNQHLLIYRGYKGQQYYTIVGNRLYLQDADDAQGGHVFSRTTPGTASHTPPAILH